MRICRKDKKKLRAISLCYTGNPECRKSKYSKKQWISEKKAIKLDLQHSTADIVDMLIKNNQTNKHVHHS